MVGPKMANLITTQMVTIADEKLGSIFGSNYKDISKVVQQAINDPGFVDIKSEANFTYKLAPCFGKLTSESMKAMDDQLKVMIAGTTNSLQENTKNKMKLADDNKKAADDPSRFLSWEEIVSILSQNVMIETQSSPNTDNPPKQVDEIFKSDHYSYGGTSFFKVDGSPDQQIINEILSWWKNFVADSDIIQSTNIDVNPLAKITAETGAHVNDPINLIVGKEYLSKTLLDVGVLRYPDIDHPYFKIYRLKVTAFRNCHRILFAEDNKNGFLAELNVRKYKPRQSVMDGLRKTHPEIWSKAIDEAVALFA